MSDFHFDPQTPRRSRIREVITTPSSIQEKVTEDPRTLKTHGKFSLPLVPVCIGMFIMVVLITFSYVGWPLVQEKYDDFHYGYPRTTQADAWVGHEGEDPTHPSHFTAMNWHGQVVITELPGGNAAQARTYTGPQVFGDALTRVSLSFGDLDGNGTKDMTAKLGNNITFFRNDGKVFVPSSGNFKLTQ